MKDLLGLKNLSREQISEILNNALAIKKQLLSGEKKAKGLENKSIITLFYENSTRTRVSFELAAKFLSAVAVNISASSSSVQKGETLIDTGKTLDAMKTDVIIMRHPMAGAPHLLAANVNASVINAGDGMNEHPTQALLDMLTLYETYGTLEGLKVAIVGDIKHSRVAKSNLFGLTTMGATVSMYAPKTLMLPDMESKGAVIAASREEALKDADAVMGLRIQLERQKGGLFPSLSEYSKFFGIDDKHMKFAKENAIVMHPGPVNRGVELSTGVIDGECSRITDQVLSGVAVRMAVLKLLCKEAK